MKVLLSLTCLFGVILAIEGFDAGILGPMGKEHLEACAKELNVDVASVDIQKEEYKCLPKCMLQQYGLVDETGKFIVERIKGKVDLKDELKSKIKRCADEHIEEDVCTRYKEIILCVTKA